MKKTGISAPIYTSKKKLDKKAQEKLKKAEMEKQLEESLKKRVEQVRGNANLIKWMTKMAKK